MKMNKVHQIPSLMITNSQLKKLKPLLIYTPQPHFPSTKLSVLLKSHQIKDLLLIKLQSQSQLLLMNPMISLLTTLKTSLLLLKMPTLPLKNQMEAPTKLLPLLTQLLLQPNQTQIQIPIPIQIQMIPLMTPLQKKKLKNVTQSTFIEIEN